MDDPNRAADLLGSGAPVPVDRPFHRREALIEGVPDRTLAAWCAAGYLRHPLRGVYHAAQLPDGLDLRIACLRLVVPDDAVVTDRTAGWLHGATQVLAPNDHLAVPAVSMFRPPGYRLRNGFVSSGERTFLPGEVVDLGGVRATSILRTTCDLGRMRHRDQAFSAMDAMMRIADFTVEDLCEQGARFRGYRGVRQFRALAPLVDARSQSPGESVLRLRWLDCLSLPRPSLQVAVTGSWGTFSLDLGLESLRYAAEYDGAHWHGPERREHDASRRRRLRDEAGWSIDVFVDSDVFGRAQNAEARLVRGVARARARLGLGSWSD